MKPIHFAPLQGYTDDVYRRAHHKLIGGVTNYYTPFIRVEVGEIRSKDIRDISPENNKNTPVVPQIIFNSRKEFEYLTQRIEEAGYKQIDLNMGCPFPLQAKHGRGAGILPHLHIIEDIISGIKEHPQITFSVKMRLGWQNNTEAEEIIKKLNEIKLKHIALHPRTGIQQYKGDVNMLIFDKLYSISSNPIIYNGDIRSIEDIRNIEEKYPMLAGIMIGRGLLSCPTMAYEYSTNNEWSVAQRISAMLQLHENLKTEYSRYLNGDYQLHNKLRTFWEYSEPLIGRKPYKKIMKSGNLKNYNIAVEELKYFL